MAETRRVKSNERKANKIGSQESYSGRGAAAIFSVQAAPILCYNAAYQLPTDGHQIFGLRLQQEHGYKRTEIKHPLSCTRGGLTLIILLPLASPGVNAARRRRRCIGRRELLTQLLLHAAAPATTTQVVSCGRRGRNTN
ncbi:hypothetical protein EVAR_47103_1 [Eumeta japonica]|uniref:Uncharacterized protein n=1 Tax=Eumeta variegata TaxID=151549 RepID=A0A4C1YDV4_EUMVA|nr:hypothetical protein EVAR_47103_1 [Eumeta japonica]